MPDGGSGGAVLSIQSRVGTGYVGNSAAAFALQRLGREVWTVDTVRFSNHPGHGAWTGAVADPTEASSLVDGIAARGVLPGCAAVLSGYLGTPAMGEVVLHAAALARAANPAALFCCDPVMGDSGPGLYVRPGIPELFRDRMLAEADVLTPNQFELQYLSGIAITTAAALGRAAAAVRAAMRPAATLLVTSVRLDDTPVGCVDMAVFGSGGWRLRTPLLPAAFSGAGDLTAAVFLHHLLHAPDPPGALEGAAAAVFGVLARTAAAGAAEMRLVAAQDELTAPTRRFRADVF